MDDYLDSFDSPFQYDYWDSFDCQIQCEEFFIEDYNCEYESIEQNEVNL